MTDRYLERGASLISHALLTALIALLAIPVLHVFRSSGVEEPMCFAGVSLYDGRYTGEEFDVHGSPQSGYTYCRTSGSEQDHGFWHGPTGGGIW